VSIVNKLFCIIFARYRRKLGDSIIESAWLQANSKVTAYLGSLIIAAEFLIFLVLYFPVIKGTAFDSKPAIVASGTAICLLVAYSIGRGFRAYLSDPPRWDALGKPVSTETAMDSWANVEHYAENIQFQYHDKVIHRTWDHSGGYANVKYFHLTKQIYDTKEMLAQYGDFSGRWTPEQLDLIRK